MITENSEQGNNLDKVDNWLEKLFDIAWLTSSCVIMIYFWTQNPSTWYWIIFKGLTIANTIMASVIMIRNIIRHELKCYTKKEIGE